MTSKFCGLCLALLLLGASLAGAQAQSQPREQGADAAGDAPPLGQLPAEVRPLHYSLDLTIRPDRDRFNGRARIDIALERETDAIWFHGKDIAAERVQALDAGGITVAAYSEVDDTGVAKLVFERPVGPGRATLVIDYSAAFNHRLKGLYRVDTEGRSYAFTQFEPISARLAFPGFDEPRFKTPFDIALTVDAGNEAISNAPVRDVALLENGLKRVRFKTTKPLPTYLIAFAVGDLDIVEWAPIPASEIRDREVPLRGIAAKGKGGRFAYALANTADLLNILEEYFGTPYPYEKLDLIAAPDFASGAMENAGAIVYRESLMLFDDHPSLYQKRSYAYVHAHELAHQWFGNLVTPAWWDDLWLNEAFATWMSDRVVHSWKPGQYDDRNPQRRAQGAMRTDSLASARQIRQPVRDHHDISNAFDSITYSKGGGVLAMFEKRLGAEVFRQGIRDHMARFAWGTATAEDFMQSLAKAAGDGIVTDAFRSFLDQPGVPLVEATWRCGADGGTEVSLKQTRYLPVGSSASAKRLWRIPICLAYDEGGTRRTHCSYLAGAAEKLSLPTKSCPKWIMPNAEGAGYFRWTLAQPGWKALISALDRLSDKEALALSDSLGAAFRAGALDAEDYLRTVDSIIRREAWDVAKSPMGHLSFIKDFLVPRASAAEVRDYLGGLYASQMSRLGLQDDTPGDRVDPVNTALLRGKVAWFLALQAERPDLRQELTGMGTAYLGYGGDGKLHPERIHPNLVRLALIVAAQELGAPFVDALLVRFERSSDSVFRGHVLQALARLTEPALAARVRDLILSPILKTRERSRLLHGQARRIANRDDLWAWFRAHKEEVLRLVPASRRGGLPWIAGRFCSESKQEEVEAYFTPLVETLEGGPRTLANVLERIELCSALAARQGPSVTQFFARD